MNKTYKKGELIISEGSSGDESFIIQSGRVEVYRTVNGKKVKNHEIELDRGKENIIIVGSSDSVFKFEVSVS